MALEKYKISHILREINGYMILEMYDHVIERADFLLENQESVIEALTNKAEALKLKKNYEAAINVYNELLSKKMNKETERLALLGLGWCNKRINRLDKAISYLEELNKRQPEEAIALFNLSCYYSLNKRRDESLKLLKKAVEKDGRYKSLAREDEDYHFLKDDPEFKNIIGEN